MHFVPPLLLLVLSGAATLAQVADAPHPLAESAARQHLVKETKPTYPPIAKAINAQGDVVVSVVIGTTGAIESEKIISGPPMLRGAALDALKGWRFTPFEVDGIAAAVATTFVIPFHLDKQPGGPTAVQEKAAQATFPLSDKCRASLRAQDIKAALDVCKQALDMSLAAGDLTSSDQLVLLNAHEEYGHALLAGGKVQEALVEEAKAVDVAKAHLKDTDQEFAMPYYWRAMVEEALGQGDAASSDLSVAEETHRRAMAHLPEGKAMYSRNLANILKQHAALLEQMGKPADAAKLRAEAASL